MAITGSLLVDRCLSFCPFVLLLLVFTVELLISYLSLCEGSSVRLVGGTRFEGLMEFFYNGVWGTVCDDIFEANANGPTVTCKMLGLSRYGAYVEQFKDGTGDILIDDILCSGTENDILSCTHNPVGPGQGCSHPEDSGIVCGSTSFFTHGADYVIGKSFATTLSGGSGPWEGIVEMRRNTVKGTVCSTGFDNADAAVVCRFLGFSSKGAHAVDSSLFTSTHLGIVYGNFGCNGNEERPELCNYSNMTSCNSARLAAVKCDHTNVRLVGGSTISEGQLEVQNKHGVWGTVCGKGFDRNDANVVCKMLGYGDTVVEFSSTSKYVSETGPTFLSNLQCTGSEVDVGACNNVVWNSTRDHKYDVGINCKSTKIRLVGPSPYEGRVEVYYNGTWGTVCDNNFGSYDSKIVCRMLGFESTGTIYANAHFGQGSGKTWLDNVNCNGHENDLSQCSSPGFGRTTCTHTDDVSVSCFTDFKMRLTGNNRNHNREGRLEIYVNGQWYIICDEQFTTEQADAACQYLGYPKSTQIYSSNRFGKGSGRYLSMSKPCSYDKTDGWKCIMKREYAGLAFCDDVGIRCAKTELRLVNGPTSHEGRVEVKHNGIWGTICCNGFVVQSADVICKSLGFKGQREVLLHGNYGQGTGPVWLQNVKCHDNSTDIFGCSDSWKDDSCSHGCDVGVKCVNTPIRLVNGTVPFQGRIEVQHNTAWGTIQSVSAYGGDTVCRMMNYNMSDVFSNIRNDVIFGKSLLRQWLRSISCEHDDMDIEGCMRHTNQVWTSSSAAANNAGVQCLLKVRLVDGPDGNSGRAEVMRNGRWGSLCTKTMTDGIATDICKMAVFPEHTMHVTGKALHAGFYGRGEGPIWKLRDGCINDIARCLLPDSEHEDCNHGDDVSVYCDSNTELRLTGGHRTNEGRVEVKYNGEWTGICDSNWHSIDANTVCKSLGYWINSASARQNSWYGNSSGPMWLMEPTCNSADNDIALCKAINQYGKGTCPHTHEAGVSCVATNLGRTHIRLVDGPGPWKGTVEVETSRGRWGGFCWSNWNSKNTQAVCRTLQYSASGAYTSYSRSTTSTVLFLSTLHCSGIEGDIGMCSGNFDIQNCSTEAVAVDCTGGIAVRLINGSNSFEGRVEVKVAGEWKSVCDTNWDTNDAKTVCTMLGLPATHPAVLRNARFGQSSTRGHVDDLGCIGWEDHLQQCVIHDGGTCTHAADAAVQCTSCVHEFHSETGQLASPNYPGNYVPSTDCVYTIRPHGSKAYVLSVDDLSLHPGDTVEIKEGRYGRHIISLDTSFKPIKIVSGSEFHIRFKSLTGNSGKGLHLSWRPMIVKDTITVGCGSDTWDITVNMTLLKQLYTDTIPELVFFPDSNCRGKWREDSLVFENRYTECRTQRQDINNDIVYRNQLMYPESNIPHPVIIRNFRWKQDVACKISKVNSGHINFQPNENGSIATHPGTNNSIVGNGKERINLQFYTDQHFYQQISGNPISVQIGEDVYVRVTVVSTNDDYKMRIHSCYAMPTVSTPMTEGYTLIKDGCSTDSSTKIISQGLHETKFSFNAFEFHNSKDNVYVECNATFCQKYDTTPACNQVCHTKRQIIDVPSMTYTFTKIGRSPVFIMKQAKTGYRLKGDNTRQQKQIT